jgi:hypothetical protein
MLPSRASFPGLRSRPRAPISALFHELDDGAGNLGGSRTVCTILMDYLRQRIHVIQSFQLPIHLEIAMEELAQLVVFFIHLTVPLSGPAFPVLAPIFSPTSAIEYFHTDESREGKAPSNY